MPMSNSDSRKKLEETFRENDNDLTKAYEAMFRQFEAMREDRDKWKDAATELNNAISWDTTCLNCSRLLDQSYGEYVKGHKEAVEDMKSLIEELFEDFWATIRSV